MKAKRSASSRLIELRDHCQHRSAGVASFASELHPAELHSAPTWCGEKVGCSETLREGVTGRESERGKRERLYGSPFHQYQYCSAVSEI